MLPDFGFGTVLALFGVQYLIVVKPENFEPSWPSSALSARCCWDRQGKKMHFWDDKNSTEANHRRETSRVAESSISWKRVQDPHNPPTLDVGVGAPPCLFSLDREFSFGNLDSLWLETSGRSDCCHFCQDVSGSFLDWSVSSKLCHR